MYYQAEPGIYVYQYKKSMVFGDLVYENIIDVSYYKDLYTYASNFYRESGITDFVGTAITDRFCNTIIGQKKRGRYWSSDIICNNKNCQLNHKDKYPAVVVYDHNAKLVTPDRIVGEWRKYRRDRYECVTKQYNRVPGSKGKGYRCHYRSYTTTLQEIKWAHAWDDEEFAPKTRPARCAPHLPIWWDDFPRQYQRNWKRQSKRKHQWKEK